MSDVLGVGQATRLLGRLQQAVCEAAAKGAQLEQEFRAQTRRERLTQDSELASAGAALATALSEAEAAAQANRQCIGSRFDQRRSRIDRALKETLGGRLQQIEEHEGRRKYLIQKNLLQASRTRDTERANAELAFEQFKVLLAEEHQSFEALKRRAAASFGSYRKLLRPADEIQKPLSSLMADENKLLDQFRELMTRTVEAVERFRKSPVPLLFRLLPFPLLIALVVIGHVSSGALLHFAQTAPVPYERLGASLGGALVLVLVLFFLGRGNARMAGAEIGTALEKIRRLHGACGEAAARRHQQHLDDLDKTFEDHSNELNQEWGSLRENPASPRQSARATIESKAARAATKLERFRRLQLERAEQARIAELARLRARAAEQQQHLPAAQADRMSQLIRAQDARWQALGAELKAITTPIYLAFEAANGMAEKLFPPWQPQSAERWSAPAEFAHAARFGRIEVDVEKFAGVAPTERRVALPGSAQFSIPLLLDFPRGGSLLFETSKFGHEQAVGALNNLILRLLSASPTNRLNFSIIDPVGLGQNFAGVTHLADYGENLISGRIWTQPAQIEKRLAELNEHMEKVIQMYLRNEYETIADYNEKAGNIAEKYHFLVVADFPANFSETATKRLLSIAASGARCGVFTFIHWDRRQKPAHEIVADDLHQGSVCLLTKGNDFVLAGGLPEGAKLVLDPPPEASVVTAFIQKVGEDSLHANRVEVPFAQIAPAEEELWSLDTTTELRVPIGRTGATKLQYLAIGQGTRQHMLVAGKTGSGKSTLFHVIITNLSLWCSPAQVEFYLVDFKKGVEFQCYAAKRLPHARVIAIESDREFGLSVLQRLDDELRRRGELFRRHGVQDLAGYKRAGGVESVPRSLLIIDEFQEFFVEDDRIAQGAALLLDRIVRQGRAFGIHVLLGSQTLGGAYTLARTTLGQMVIRIALQCNEADAYLIMDDNNPAPRLLSRPGEGIYNDTAGSIEGNSPFQTVWLPDDVRDGYLEMAVRLAKQKSPTCPEPIIFEGNAPADVRENPLLQAALATKPPAAPPAARCWLGAPNSIKGPTEVVFQRQSGNNLLIVGQRDEAALALLAVGLVSLAAQYPAGTARFIVLDANAPGSPEREYLDDITRIIPHGLKVARGAEMEAMINTLAEDLKVRTEATEAARPPETFLLIHGLQKHKKLRFEEDFGFAGNDSGAPNSGKQLNDLICEGPAHGLHVIAVCDTYNNLNRSLSRKALGEFELRVLFQMSANDSASLIDSPKAGTLGLHRAIFHNEQEGYSEVFRPYALPDAAWIEQAGRWLAG